jgi:hypothetical protein
VTVVAEYLKQCGWKRVSLNPEMWSHQMVLGSYDGYVTGEAMRTQRWHEQYGRVTTSLGGSKVPCCGALKVDGNTRERDAFDFDRRSSLRKLNLRCELPTGHKGPHVTAAVGKEKQFVDEWEWEDVPLPRKGQAMAGAYEATLQVYRNEHGISLVTDATTLDGFNASIAKVDWAGLSEYDRGKLVEQVEEIACKLKGYKSDVTERRLLIAGQSMPPAIDMVFSTGPGLPSVEIAATSGAEGGAA